MRLLDQALEMHQATGDRQNEAETRRLLAEAYRDLGELKTASSHARRAIRLAREVEAQRFEISARSTLATVLIRLGEAERGLTEHARRGTWPRRKAIGISTAPIHAEVKVTATSIELIEIHTRYGGDLIPVLMERALGIKPLALCYDALLGNQPPTANSPLHKVAGVRFLPETVRITGTRLPPLPPGTEAELVITGRKDSPEHLDNVRIVNRRGGHVMFTAPTHAEADDLWDALTHEMEMNA